LRIDRTRPQPKNGIIEQTGTGRMHAAPTDRGERHTTPIQRISVRRGQDPALQNEANKQWFHNPARGVCPRAAGIAPCNDMVYSVARTWYTVLHTNRDSPRAFARGLY